MKQVTKSEFKQVYVRLGGGRDGWDEAHWQSTFEHDSRPGMRFMIEEPETARHVKMWIVSDYAVNEYRLFFMTEEDSDDMLEFPSTQS